jgi:hydroxymethylglutaryl-CoA lyase
LSGWITINEVGLRDGLQNQPRHVPLEQKKKLLQSLLDAGVRSLEITSFVSPRAVPQMADAADLMAALPAVDGADYSVLVPNMRGYERAVASGARSVALVVACTETMNQRNINMSLETAAKEAEAVIARARAEGVTPRAYLATAFVCPFEGSVRSEVVHGLADRMFGAGAAEVIIADTIGGAAPAEVARMFPVIGRKHGIERLSGHFHDTKGMALANCYAALMEGVRKFDASIGGLGGCPFAPGAAGNAATEDLVNMLHASGWQTGIDLDGLLAAVAVAEAGVGAPLGGKWAAWRRSRLKKEQTAQAG